MAERPLRVLVAHNMYRSEMPSGENMVVLDEIEMLREAGVEVIPFLRSSDSIPSMPLPQKLGVATGPVYNPWGVRDFKRALREEKPDVVHVHNTNPLVSPWIVRTAQAAGIRTVATFHNYRLTCLRGTHTRNSRACNLCEDRRFALSGVRHSCYQSSVAKSIPVAVGQSWHRSTWRGLDAAICPSQSLAQTVQRLLPDVPVDVIPNPVPDPGPPRPLGDTVLYVGRLDEDKGIAELIQAWTSLSTTPAAHALEVVGDGPLRQRLQEAARSDPRIRFHGSLAGESLSRRFQAARLVAVPSQCPETFGRVVIEAFAHGRPVLVTEMGALPELVSLGTGWSCPPSPAGIARGLHLALSGSSERNVMRARNQFLKFKADYVTPRLISLLQGTPRPDEPIACSMRR